jgi:Xaa-Pro aminopeptidase
MYTVDYPRFAALGTATTEQRRVHEAARHVKHRMAGALRPGVTCAELYRVALAACEEADVEPADRGRRPGTARMGHGQGMNVTEPPSITPEDQTMLEPGVVISLEPGVRGSAERGAVECVWEDTYVVTAEGPEQLTLETEELREIPF